MEKLHCYQYTNCKPGIFLKLCTNRGAAYEHVTWKKMVERLLSFWDVILLRPYVSFILGQTTGIWWYLCFFPQNCLIFHTQCTTAGRIWSWSCLRLNFEVITRWWEVLNISLCSPLPEVIQGLKNIFFKWVFQQRRTRFTRGVWMSWSSKSRRCQPKDCGAWRSPNIYPPWN